MSTVALRLGGASFRLARRVVLVNLLLALGVHVLLLSGLMGGTYPIAGADVVAAFQGTADPITSMVVLENRLPRVVTALGVGLALGLAGEMMQTLLRNPIASPDIIGFTAGAGCGAVFTVAFLGTSTLVVPGALAGGLLAAALVIGLSWQRGISPGQLVITGIGVTMTLGVVTDLLMTRMDATAAAALVKWLVGSLQARSLDEAKVLWIGLAILGPLALRHQFALARVSMSEEVATSLGVDITRARLITLGLSVALVALAVAAAGPLPFVAFVAGPIAHGLNGKNRPTLLTAALVGAIITLSADAVSQLMPSGFGLPAGVFTALVGAPVLIWVLLVHYRKQRS